MNWIIFSVCLSAIAVYAVIFHLPLKGNIFNQALLVLNVFLLILNISRLCTMLLS